MEWLLKRCFGRASTGVQHLKPGEPLPKNIDIGEHNWHIAQEWIKGYRYCSYSVIRRGKVVATGLYPVLETIDSSSSVFLQQQYHGGIYNYIERLVTHLGDFGGQLANDFIEVNSRLVVIECKPRSTSGLHLWTNSPYLARAFINLLDEGTDLAIVPPKTRLGHPPRVQVSPGMSMWEHENATPKTYARHMKRLAGTRDVIWKIKDMMPSLMQPFLLTVYYQMCRETSLQLPEFSLACSLEAALEREQPRRLSLGKESEHDGTSR